LAEPEKVTSYDWLNGLDNLALINLIKEATEADLHYPGFTIETYANMLKTANAAADILQRRIMKEI
jgi:hypothetical protein